MKPTVYLIAKHLKPAIGAHVPMIGKCVFDDVFIETQSKSDQSVSLAKYLICHLADYRQAEIFAKLVGMPGYINLRGKL